MTDTEERIAKLQKLLDRVLTRAEPEPEEEPDPPAEPAEDRNGETTQVSETGTPAQTADAAPIDPVPAAEAAPPAVPPPPVEMPAPRAPEEDHPIPLESRSRLVIAQAESAEELSDDDLVPASEGPDEAMPLVRRSRRAPGEMEPTEELASEELVSEGRIQVSLEDVQMIDGERAMREAESLAAEIAAEEVHSSELQEDAPASSRRPIATESIARDEEYSSPRHTPPPESGKQVAVAPGFDDESPPASARNSTTAPPSAMRDPDVVRPELAAGARVPTFTEPSSSHAPTFGELLDVALSL